VITRRVLSQPTRRPYQVSAAGWRLVPGRIREATAAPPDTGQVTNRRPGASMPGTWPGRRRRGRGVRYRPVGARRRSRLARPRRAEVRASCAEVGGCQVMGLLRAQRRLARGVARYCRDWPGRRGRFRPSRRPAGWRDTLVRAALCGSTGRLVSVLRDSWLLDGAAQAMSVAVLMPGEPRDGAPGRELRRAESFLPEASGAGLTSPSRWRLTVLAAERSAERSL
jgi:hypothetical protein